MMWRHKILQLKERLEATRFTVAGISINALMIFWWGVIVAAFLTLDLKYWVQLLSLLVAIILHEVAHGWVAFKLGDPTAKNLGRLSLNPAVHLDLIGSFVLPGMMMLSGTGVLFGWAKPVPVDPRYFRDSHKGMMLVAMAGPLTNLAIAWFSGQFLVAVGFLPYNMQEIAVLLLSSSILVNIVLAIFNCIPVPPLDGSRVLSYFLPLKGRLFLHQLENYGFLIIFILLYLGFFDVLIRRILPVVLKLIVPSFL